MSELTRSEIAMPNFTTDLSSEVALVTGATSGLGWHFARVLASCGAKVVITGRRAERLTELASVIESDGGQAYPLTLDMTSADNIVDVVNQSEEHFGTITILVNNAGIPDAQFATKMEVDLIDRVIGTNLRGPFILTTEVAKRLIAAKRPGRVVNLSSIAAFNYAGNGAALYSVTKAAMVRMTEALAVEWSRYKINVNGIAPGVFHSEMTQGMIDRVGDMSSHYPRKRLGVPSQLDSTLLYLCSPSSECVTGTVIKVDDGQEIR